MDVTEGINAVVGRKRLADKICRVCGDNAINVMWSLASRAKRFFAETPTACIRRDASLTGSARLL
ncbi:hypothetical protein CRE_14537 [Caenorhabditis remanei]|uniref:Uncharacterized protein n=1 Tax=Caenorhabditis remanei TaxID=31234 RepID=E3M9E8_CAERE|nr:hypothetical protein CRE_14537 [Caenorhabditis remanei]